LNDFRVRAARLVVHKAAETLRSVMSRAGES
jgi:hypothetical protein